MLIREILRRSLWQVRTRAGQRRGDNPLARTVCRLSLLAGVSLLVGAALSCGRSDDHAGSPDSTITVLYDADERIFGPYWSMEAWFLMFLPLVTYDANGDIVGRLARSWAHSPDFRSWTFHLRPDVRWHDGEPVTAGDVKFSIELSAHPDILHDDAWHDVDSIAVRDDTTLTIFSGRPKDARDTWNVYWPKHLLEGLDPKEFYRWEFWIHPVGNGPYRYVRHVPETMMELEANPDYYLGKPKIDRLVLKFGRGAGLTELLSGNVDVLTWVNRAEIPKLAADPRFKVYYNMWPGVGWLRAIFWNHRKPPFDRPAIRRALTLAMDRRELLRILNMPEELAITDALFTGRQYTNGDLPEPLPYDPALAERLLEREGWRDVDGDGVIERDGREFVFTALVPSGDELEQVAVYVQAALRRLGVRMEVQPLESSLVRRRVETGDFQGAFFDYWNAVDGHLRWLGEGSPLGYDNPRVAELLARLKETADPTAQDRVYRNLRPQLQEDLPLTFLFPQLQTYVVPRRLRGLHSPYRGDPMQFMEELWVEEEGGQP